MEDRLREEIKKELDYSNKKLEEMEKLVKSLAQRKPKVYILLYTEENIDGAYITTTEARILGAFSTYEKAKANIIKFANGNTVFEHNGEFIEKRYEGHYLHDGSYYEANLGDGHYRIVEEYIDEVNHYEK